VVIFAVWQVGLVAAMVLLVGAGMLISRNRS
jgi:hypothetical protein